MLYCLDGGTQLVAPNRGRCVAGPAPGSTDGNAIFLQAGVKRERAANTSNIEKLYRRFEPKAIKTEAKKKKTNKPQRDCGTSEELSSPDRRLQLDVVDGKSHRRRSKDT